MIDVFEVLPGKYMIFFLLDHYVRHCKHYNFVKLSSHILRCWACSICNACNEQKGRPNRNDRITGGKILKDFMKLSTIKVSVMVEGLVAMVILTHWGQVTHICVSKIIIIGSENGQHQAIIWTNVGIVLIGPLGMNFSEILIEINIFSFKKMHLKILSVKWRPSCLSLSV